MAGVLTALGTMGAVVAVGWVLGRFGLLGGDGAERVLARVVFAVATPCLMVVTIAHADLQLLLSRSAVVIWGSTGVVVLVAAAVLRGLWRRPVGEATIGVLASGYVNAGNLGIPIAVYLLGDAVAVVPTLLFQLLVLAPVAFAALDAQAAALDPRTAAVGTPHATAVRRPARVLARTLQNPIIIGALTGLLLAALPWDVPDVALEPFRLIGAAAAPLALLTLGLSLAAPRPSGARDAMATRELTLVVVLRSVVHPLLAAGLGRALGLEGMALLGVVTMAALPTAQNVLVYALRYGRATALARDAGVVTTALAVPVMLVIGALLG